MREFRRMGASRGRGYDISHQALAATVPSAAPNPTTLTRGWLARAPVVEPDARIGSFSPQFQQNRTPFVAVFAPQRLHFRLMVTPTRRRERRTRSRYWSCVDIGRSVDST
jgi:hypothetical protein